MIQKLPLPVPIVLPEKPAMRSTGVNTLQPIVKDSIVSRSLRAMCCEQLNSNLSPIPTGCFPFGSHQDILAESSFPFFVSVISLTPMTQTLECLHVLSCLLFVIVIITWSLKLMSFPFALQETSEPIQVVAPPERDFEGELQRLRESLEAQVRAAQAEAEKQRRRAEEVPWEPGRCGSE